MLLRLAAPFCLILFGVMEISNDIELRRPVVKHAYGVEKITPLRGLTELLSYNKLDKKYASVGLLNFQREIVALES